MRRTPSARFPIPNRPVDTTLRRADRSSRRSVGRPDGGRAPIGVRAMTVVAGPFFAAAGLLAAAGAVKLVRPPRPSTGASGRSTASAASGRPRSDRTLGRAAPRPGRGRGGGRRGLSIGGRVAAGALCGRLSRVRALHGPAASHRRSRRVVRLLRRRRSRPHAGPRRGQRRRSPWSARPAVAWPTPSASADVLRDQPLAGVPFVALMRGARVAAVRPPDRGPRRCRRRWPTAPARRRDVRRQADDGARGARRRGDRRSWRCWSSGCCAAMRRSSAASTSSARASRRRTGGADQAAGAQRRAASSGSCPRCRRPAGSRGVHRRPRPRRHRARRRRDDGAGRRASTTTRSLAFLSSGCLTCRRFWDAFAEPGRSCGLPSDVRLVGGHQGSGGGEPVGHRRSSRPPTVPLVMSSQAWADYDVPGSPYFVLVDGPIGRGSGRGHRSRLGAGVSPAGAGHRRRIGGRRTRRQPRPQAGRRRRARGRASTRSCSPPASCPATASLYQVAEGPADDDDRLRPRARPRDPARPGARGAAGGAGRHPQHLVAVRRVDALEHHPARGAGTEQPMVAHRRPPTSPARSSVARPSARRSARSACCFPARRRRRWARSRRPRCWGCWPS